MDGTQKWCLAFVFVYCDCLSLNWKHRYIPIKLIVSIDERREKSSIEKDCEINSGLSFLVYLITQLILLPEASGTCFFGQEFCSLSSSFVFCWNSINSFIVSAQYIYLKLSGQLPPYWVLFSVCMISVSGHRSEWKLSSDIQIIVMKGSTVDNHVSLYVISRTK